MGNLSESYDELITLYKDLIKKLNELKEDTDIDNWEKIKRENKVIAFIDSIFPDEEDKNEKDIKN